MIQIPQNQRRVLLSYFVATVKQIMQHDGWMKRIRCWEILPREQINHNAYFTCRVSLLTAELLLSVINLCWFLAPPQLHALCLCGLALCQQLFLPEWIEACTLLADVWECGCVHSLHTCMGIMYLHAFVHHLLFVYTGPTRSCWCSRRKGTFPVKKFTLPQKLGNKSAINSSRLL